MTDGRWLISWIVWFVAGVMVWFGASRTWDQNAAWLAVGIVAVAWIAVSDICYAIVMSRVASAERLKQIVHKH